MKTSLSHLPENKQHEILRIMDIIRDLVDPEKIILFGSHAKGDWVHEKYIDKHRTSCANAIERTRFFEPNLNFERSPHLLPSDDGDAPSLSRGGPRACRGEGCRLQRSARLKKAVMRLVNRT